MAKKQIEMLKGPSLKLIDLVAEEMGKVVQGAVSKVYICISWLQGGFYVVYMFYLGQAFVFLTNLILLSWAVARILPYVLCLIKN